VSTVALRCGFLAVLASLLTATTAGADTIWIEGESLAGLPAGFKTGGWGNTQYLSGGQWLFASIDGKDVQAVPAEGLLLSYAFEAKNAANYEVWARVGYEGIRAPMKWRIDSGAWGEDRPDHLTTDLMTLQDWNEVAWVQLGTANLTPGKHTLEIRFDRRVLPGKQQPERILTGLDCFCISSERFRPNGRFKPDEEYRDDHDKKAAQYVFPVPEGAAPEGAAPKGATPRRTVSLKGVWEMARWDEGVIKDRAEPARELPADYSKRFWKAAAVPANRDDVRPEWQYAHRFLYRTRFQAPVDGGAYVLRFPSTALIASVFVNGTFCAGNTTPCAAWDADIRAAVKPGQVNEIVVAIKDLYYAIESLGDGKSIRTLFNYPTSWFYSGSNGGGATRNSEFPVLLQVSGAGILETPTLTVTAGPVYVDDVFVKPSVRKKELGLEIKLRNATASAQTVRLVNEVTLVDGAKVEKTLAVREHTIPAHGERTLEVAETWESPKLWWPDQPHMYQARTNVFIGDKVVDSRLTRFGFREWQWQGQHFTLNGVPWHFHADTSFGGKHPDQERAAIEAYWKKAGINTVRYWGQRPWVGASQEETLDYFDRIGMPVRRSGIFDGEGGSYNLVENKNGKTVARQALFDNWIRQTQAQVRAERNHPSVFVWSIENEVTFINIRNWGLHEPCEPEIRRAVQAILKLDPTRPAMIDGGDALRDKSLPIYGNHYNEANFRHYPDEAYTMKLAFNRYKDPWAPWPIGDDKPLFLGESFFANGYPPAAYAAVIGEQAFLGRNAAEPGVFRFARMLSEGYRWHGLAGFHFWFDANNVEAEHYKAFQPVCVFVREWNVAFAGGSAVPRTLKVFNDTRSREPIELEWSFRVDGKAFAEGAETCLLEPGTAKELSILLRTPKVTARTAGELVLTLHRGGQPVFRDVKPCHVLADLPSAPALTENQLAVYDPKGTLTPWLKQRGYLCVSVASLDKLPQKLHVLLVGADALTPREATDPRWVALAAQGTRVLVLDQANPLHYQAVPADLGVTDYVGRIVFPENLDHPSFVGLGKDDFFCWSGDHVVYRNAYKKASRGARSLLQCDDELSCTALAECPVQDGVLVLCQAAIGSKLGADPVAQRLLDNLIRYCLDYRLPAKKTVVALPDGDPRLKLIESIGLKYSRDNDLVVALRSPEVEIVVADASPANLARLAKAPDVVQAFTKRGGHVMLWGLTPEGLASYNRVVGIDHVIRPFGMERVTLPAVRDPLLAGLTNRDVAQEGTEQIFPWSGDRYPAKDTFTDVVDLDDIAPFAKSAKYAHGWSQMTNGLTSADAWKFIFYHELKNDPHPKWSAELPKAEEVTGFSIVLNTHYQVITKLRLIFDDNLADAETLTLKDTAELKQEFALKPRRCQKITLEPIAFDTRGKQPTTGVDNIWIKVKRSEDYHQRVVPLLNMGGLVKYRMGTGGVILNQLRIPEREQNPVNGPKKQNIVATVLRNLGATFAAERLIVAGANMRYTPVPLEDKCTQFLTVGRGWPLGKLDLAHFPIGAQKLTGVDYLIRDFKTSPLPACIMLDGPGIKGMPKAVDGIAVGQQADALFFLHTFDRKKGWQPQGDKKEPPALFTYVVHYADGKTVDVPVRYGRGADQWIAEQPHGLPEATVAWAAPFPQHVSQQAVVYQMTWTNPRPDVTIRSVDVRSGDGYGVPIVLGITVGKVK
jgi:Glycosyl hydrolases family 2/Glycosyl hydrolases family 2, TIM barrel domain